MQPGEDNRVKPDIIHITDIKPGDYFYMCSDGMLEQMEDDELFKLLSGKGSDQKKLRQLIAATSENDDNHSAYLIHIEAVPRELIDDRITENEELTARCNALNIKVIQDNKKDDDDADDATQLAPATKPIVKRPRRRKKKTLTWLWWAMLIAAIVAVAVWLALYGLQDKHKQGNGQHNIELSESQTSKSTTPPMIQRKIADDKVHTIRHLKEKKSQPAVIKTRPAAVTKDSVHAVHAAPKAVPATANNGPKIPSVPKSKPFSAGSTSDQQTNGHGNN